IPLLLLPSITHPRPPISSLFPYTTLFRSALLILMVPIYYDPMFMSGLIAVGIAALLIRKLFDETGEVLQQLWDRQLLQESSDARSEEHTSELQSRENLVCRLLLEKKNHRK